MASLSAMARWKSPRLAGLARWRVTHMAPADCPKSVTESGLPPKCAKPSPLVDEYGDPMCPIELVHGYITRDGERYGLVHSMLGLQDEINHRRSKALHMLSTRQLWYEQGAVPNARKVAEQIKLHLHTRGFYQL